ncbi:MAG: hypothetical protein Q9M39_04665 [Sulfurovum sp.]|nr:hypothetical protein [Sulfurovum sp.]
MPTLRPYYFLFIARDYFKIESQVILDRLAVPNRYTKKIERPALPKNISASFIARLSLKEGIKEYVGNYSTKVITLAEYLEVWDKPFDRGVTPTQLIAEGFEGKALGDELEKRTQEKINRLKEK